MFCNPLTPSAQRMSHVVLCYDSRDQKLSWYLYIMCLWIVSKHRSLPFYNRYICLPCTVSNGGTRGCGWLTHHNCDIWHAYYKRKAFVSTVKPTGCTNVSNYLFWNGTLHVSDGFSFHHQHFKTVHTAVKQILLSAWLSAC